jgi:hypothetical protein
MAETWPDAPDAAPESAAAVYRRNRWDRVSGATTLAVGALAVILWACGGMDVTPTRPDEPRALRRSSRNRCPRQPPPSPRLNT